MTVSESQRSVFLNMRYLALFLALVQAVVSMALERDIVVENAADKVVLSGTLAVPDDNATPRAAIVLASGSGAQDRDETVYGLKPFKVLSDSLVAKGFAVMRLDDRGVGGSTGQVLTSTTEALAGDISCALDSFKSIFPGVKTGVIGHSEGGALAMINGADCDNCDFIITLAGPAWRGDSIVMNQSRTAAIAATGRWDAEALERTLLDIAMSETIPSIATSQMMAAAGAIMPEQMAIPQVAQAMAQQFSAMTLPWYRNFLRFDPAPYIERVEVPWLALNGEIDLQVTPENLATVAALNPRAEVRVLPRHNHMFQSTDNGAVANYPRAGQSPSDATLSVIVEWLCKVL